MSLTLQNYKIDTENYPIYIYIDNGKNIWLKGNEVAKILGYENPKMAFKHVHMEDRRYSFELIGVEITLPHNWHPQTVLINENGLNQLLMKCTKPAAKPFQRWVCGEVIPSILRKGAYISPNIDTNQITTLMQSLKQRDNELRQREQERLEDRQMLVEYQKIHMEDRQLILQNQNRMLALSDKLLSVAPRVAIMPISEEYRHCLRIYKKNIIDNQNLNSITNEYRFIRVQKRYLQQAIKNINLDLEKLVCEKCNIPNGMNILNRVKEIIPADQYKSFDNVIITNINIADLVEKIFLNECL